MKKMYRYRMVFDEKYSAIPCGEWIYVDYNKFCEIKDCIGRGNKYELQAFCLIYHKLPNKD